MLGFQKNENKKDFLKKWYKLFSLTPNRSCYAKKNWNYVLKSELPNKKLENWKHTSLKKFFLENFQLPKKNNNITKNDILKFSITLNAIRLVFINGIFYTNFSNNLKDYKIKKFFFNNDNFENPIKSEIFLHLTECLSRENTNIYLKKNTEYTLPLYLLHISTGENNQLNTSHYLHNLYVEENTKIHIIEHYVSLSDFPHFTGSRLIITVKNNAKLFHTKLISENKYSYHFSHNDIKTFNNTYVCSQNFLLGNNIIRQNISTQINGQNSNITINSFSLPVCNTTSDVRTYLEHNKKNCYSRQMHKSIILNYAKSVFDGIIKVKKNAININGKMHSKSLLLDKFSEANSKPQLEIYADDIKCSHSATIGKIEKEQIFYLQSRGINKILAKKILVLAFAYDVLNIINQKDLKKKILFYISKNLLEKTNGI